MQYQRALPLVNLFIIHQTHYEKSDWSRAFNQFTIACELDMINAISAADVDFSILMYTLFRQRFYYCILKFLNDLG